MVRRELKKAKRKAKCSWQWTYAEKCQQRNFQENPKLAWKMVFKLTEGFQGHLKSSPPKMFKNSNGETAIDSMENIENLKTHWQNTFNIDMTTLMKVC